MDQLKKTQQMLTDITKVFHDFCQEHSLVYYAVGGTALGAARHQGFIPWDDDVDVAMPRPDYERLLDIFNKENINKRYILESPYSDDIRFTCPFSKIFDKQTTFIEEARYPLKRGIYIDIYPLDGAGMKPNDSRKVLKRIMRLLFFRNMRTIKISSKRSFLKNVVLAIIQCIPNAVLDEKRLSQKIDSLCKQFSFETSDYIANYVGAWGEKEIIPKKVFGTPRLSPFENIQINCPEKINDYLTCIYGDWRTPPPKEKQISTHGGYLDLTKSYLD